ncbi:MAG: LPS export ABC transporter periplasmic protein LptC [Muribaculaceae bacterium]|nr:LPS export ABC transporter periplasmic protein LptC [Muribaculaceae bacterium]
MYRLRDILLVILVLSIVWGCADDKKEVVNLQTDPETTATVVTRNVLTLVSDSGVTQYRITTDLWNMYQEASEPFWSFPEGLFLEQFDSVFNVKASIKSDSAKYYSKKQLWQLDGHVTILNTNDEVILTQQIFWDQRSHKVYSDSFIHIERKDRILEGYGFNSNERMTVYELSKPMGMFPVEERKPRNESDSLTDVSVINK